MTAKKHRLTVTLDPELVEAAQRAVEVGDAESVSSWVSAAIEDKVRRDDKLHHLRAAIADYEQEFGLIGEDEIASQQRSERQDATVVRGDRPAPSSRTKPA
jgi:Arc/MetJ-type ribon-helix-helix transcriptional regulator